MLPAEPATLAKYCHCLYTASCREGAFSETPYKMTVPIFYFTAVTVSRGTTSVDGVQNSREYKQTTAFTIARGPAQHTHSARRSRGRPEILTVENIASGSMLLTGAIGVLVYFKSGQRFARVVAASITLSVSFAAALVFTATTVRVSAFVGGVQNSSVRPKTNRRGRPSLFALWAVYSRTGCTLGALSLLCPVQDVVSVPYVLLA